MRSITDVDRSAAAPPLLRWWGTEAGRRGSRVAGAEAGRHAAVKHFALEIVLRVTPMHATDHAEQDAAKHDNHSCPTANGHHNDGESLIISHI